MKKTIIGLAVGFAVGVAATIAAGLAICEYVEHLPADNEQDDYAD